MSASDFFKNKERLKETLKVVAEKATESQLKTINFKKEEKYQMTIEQENQYLRQVLVDLWSFFGEEKNPDDYIHDLDQIRGKVFNNLLKQEELKQISIDIQLAENAKLEEIKKAMQKFYLPLSDK